MKQYKLSITLSDKSYVCNNINDEDIIIKEFKNYDQATNYIDNNFKKIKNGNNYHYYIKKKDIKNMDKKTEKKELTEKQKEDNFLDYLGLSRDDLSDDGSDLEELKELGGFNDN